MSTPIHLQVPALLISKATRYVLGFPCIAAAQLLNWQVLGLDGWWLLLAGGWLAWAPPEALESLARSSPAAVARVLGACTGDRRSQAAAAGQQQDPWASAAAQPQRGGGAGAADDGAEVLPARAWSSWFWEGSGRQRRLAAQQHQQGVSKEQDQPSLCQWRGQTSHGSGGSGVVKPPRLTLQLVVIPLLLLYHVTTPLQFLTYPSRWVSKTELV